MNEDDRPSIEHDPGEFRRPILAAIWSARIHLFLMLLIAFVSATYYRLKPFETYDWRNIPFVALWLGLLTWCICPSVPAIDANGHQSARDGFAFRLGKKLKRILNYRLRDTASRD